MTAKGNGSYSVRGKSLRCEYALAKDAGEDQRVLLKVAKQYGVVEAFFNERGELSNWISIPELKYPPVYPRRDAEQEKWLLESILGAIQYAVAVSDQRRQIN